MRNNDFTCSQLNRRMMTSHISSLPSLSPPSPHSSPLLLLLFAECVSNFFRLGYYNNIHLTSHHALQNIVKFQPKPNLYYGMVGICLFVFFSLVIWKFKTKTMSNRIHNTNYYYYFIIIIVSFWCEKKMSREWK